MSADKRRRLEQREAELVRALGGAPPPTGVDAGRVRLTATAVADKRARLVARAWPAISVELGARFEPLFADYVRAEPGGEDATADGLLFARWLDRAGLLEGEARVEAKLVSAGWRVTGVRAVRRRLPYLAAVGVRERRRLVLIASVAGNARHLTLSHGH